MTHFGPAFDYGSLTRKTQEPCSKAWGFTAGPGRPRGLLGWESLQGRLPAFPASGHFFQLPVSMTPSVPMAHPHHPFPFLLVEAFRERHRHPVKYAGALQSAQDSPGGFWYGRVLLRSLPAFLAVLPRLCFACLVVHLSPIGPPIPH